MTLTGLLWFAIITAMLGLGLFAMVAMVQHERRGRRFDTERLPLRGGEK